MYAIIKIQGKQYTLKAGDTLWVDRIKEKENSSKEFSSVLAVKDANLEIGSPYLKKAKVVTTVKKHFRGPKVAVLKKKRRKGYRRFKGHRSDLTELFVQSILLKQELNLNLKASKKRHKENSINCKKNNYKKTAPAAKKITKKKLTPKKKS